MADFTASEILNAVAQIFRAQLTPTKTGGTLDTDTEYGQLQEMVSIAFLLHPKAIYYLARLAANQLNNKTGQEVALIEDLMVALRDLGQIGTPFTDITLLSNANTALLSLDAAESVTNRPESAQFSGLMDQIAEDLRPNVTSAEGNLVRPREEARNVIRADLDRLKAIHDDVLTATFAIRDLLEVYLGLDLPSKVAASAFANIRRGLANITADLTQVSDAENIALSRDILLNALASKAAVNLVVGFEDPSNVKYKGPHNPVPSTVTQAGRAGACTPASVLSGRAPWDLPILEQLSIAVDGGVAQDVDLDVLNAPYLTTDNFEDYEIGSELHITVDANPMTKTVATGASSTDRFWVTRSGEPLRFKHLGSPIQADIPLIYTTVWTPNDPEDVFHRGIIELTTLQSFPIGAQWFFPTYVFGGVTYNNVAYMPLTPIAGYEAAIGLTQNHVGDYLRLSGDGGTTFQRFEILQVLSSTEAVIDPRNLTPADPPNPTAVLLMGSSNLDPIQVYVSPDLSNVPPVGVGCTVGPFIKTVTLSSGTKSALDLVNAVIAETDVLETAQEVGGQLNWHARPLVIDGRLALVPRSKVDPHLEVTNRFFKIPDETPPPVPGVWVDDSAHESLGLPLGRKVDNGFEGNDTLSASELAALINTSIGGAVATVETEVVAESNTLATVGGDKKVRDTTVGFGGVSIGDIIEIKGGVNPGKYRVESSASTELTLRKAEDFPGNETGLSYEISKERVKITSENETTSSSIEIVSAPTTLGFPSGVQYGTSVEFQAVNGKGEYLEFDLAEAGDVLKLPGRTPIEITEVDGDTLTLAETIPSNLINSPFTIRTVTGEQYEVMQQLLVTFTTSANLLRKNNFDENLDAIDNALTAAVLPGQNFASSRNNARNLLNDLGSLLTDTYLRESEHGVSPQDTTLNLTDILADFSPAQVAALDKVLQMMRERRYDRAVDKLLLGDLAGFYGTTSETGSYDGAVMAASRSVLQDLPDPSTREQDVDEDLHVATGYAELTDPDFDFSDSDDEFEVDDG